MVPATASQALSFDQTLYTEQSRKLVGLVNHLRDAGAQASFTVPTVVVCGNQSAGKSSLLERLCGLKLPRGAGTCTKCPTEVRLSTAAPGGCDSWCCHIKLRIEYDSGNTPLDHKPKEMLFKTLNQEQKDHLHFYISAAQRALLNPDKAAHTFASEADQQLSVHSAGTQVASDPRSNSSSFFSGRFKSFESADNDTKHTFAAPAGSADHEDTLKFTRNVVVLEVTGADVDLSLIDLPGIIQTDQASNGSNVELIKSLVQQYISSDRAIIVATITCKDDIDNQAVMQMARAADKEGSRTIGVLTKADTIEPGTHHYWLKVLQGQAYPLRLGYYCVVNPSQADINSSMSQEDAAAKELNFFQYDTFFGSTTVQSVRERLGVDALRLQLSKQLVSLTHRELPKMKKALDEVLAQTEAKLNKLPPPAAADPTFELLNRLKDLAHSVSAAVHGAGDLAFLEDVNTLFEKFREAVLSSRPTLRLTSAHSAATGASASKSTSTSTGTCTTSGKSASSSTATKPSGSNGAAGTGTTSTVTGTDPGTSSSSSSSTVWQEEDFQYWLLGPPHVGGVEPVGLITMDMSRQLAKQYRGRKLPTFQSYRVLEALVRVHTGQWCAAAEECVEGVAAVLEQLTDRLVGEHFGQFAGAHKEIRALLYQLHGELLSKAAQQINTLMEMERDQIWTQNNHYFISSKKTFEDLLFKELYSSGPAANARHNYTDSSKLPDGGSPGSVLSKAQTLLLAVGINLFAEDLDLAVARKKQKAAEEDEGLLQVQLIAGALAYLKISSKRVIDGIPMHLNHYLLKQFCSRLSALPLQLAAETVSSTAAVADGQQLSAGEGGEAGSGGHSSSSSSSVRQMPEGAGRHMLAAAARLMAEDGPTAERRAQLNRQLKQLQEVRMMLNMF